MKFQSWWHLNEKLFAVAALVLSDLICIKINSPPQRLKQSWRSAKDLLRHYIFFFYFHLFYNIFSI